jgi:hypothetical protein
MTLLFPDVMAELSPGLSAAGFYLGEDFSCVQEKIGAVEWYDSNSALNKILLESSGWIGVRTPVGSAIDVGAVVESFSYRNDWVSLDFGEGNKLYRIVVGRGYQGKFKVVMPGSDLLLLEDFYELDFNDVDDEFLIIENGEYIEGVSFITDYRAPLEYESNQKIELISVHDWSFQ